jgi:peptidoglycan-N-acetylglucosamine deacetylase
VDALSALVNGMVATGALGALSADHGVFRRISERLDHNVYRGPGARRSIALTFDDGPSPGTPEVLRYLRERGVVATFFQCGLLVERHPAIARQVTAEGHEIGNHTWSHVRLSPGLRGPVRIPSLRRMRSELASTQEVIAKVAGRAPTLFRAPFGKRWVGLDAVRQRMGLEGIQWTVIGHDWEWNADRISRHVLAHTGPGAIVCLHDGRDIQPAPDLSEMLAALRVIIPALQRQGYTFETVSQLLKPDHGGRPEPVV